jgi:2C-methyl-D-erythritol 2,4-cyclodiphosphate synthase
VSVKGKTKEGMGEVGKGEAIEAYAVVTLIDEPKTSRE